jgi:phosphoribosylformimino-5-aminoimidazole carboxamide ribotide isomerase
MFRPCIDLHEGVVKQIVGGTLKDAPKGESEAPTTNFIAALPAEHFAALYRDDGLQGGHIIMLGSGNEDSALAALRAFPGGMQVGGGIDPSNAGRYLDAGASHVIVTSYVFRDGRIDMDRLASIVSAVGGKERLVLDLSCRRRSRPSVSEADAARGFEYVVVTDRWQKWTDVVVDSSTLRLLSQHCAEFLVHGVCVLAILAAQSCVNTQCSCARPCESTLQASTSRGCGLGLRMTSCPSWGKRRRSQSRMRGVSETWLTWSASG